MILSWLKRSNLFSRSRKTEILRFKGDTEMASVFDVAQYILMNTGPISAIKLQKLVYYSQAWCLVWDGGPLFSENIEAWANGPVVRDLFYAHQGQYTVRSLPQGNPDTLTGNQRDTVDMVIRDYGSKEPQWLVELTHLEDPWKDARKNIPFGARCDRVISHASMAEYYSGLVSQ